MDFIILYLFYNFHYLPVAKVGGGYVARMKYSTTTYTTCSSKLVFI